MEGATVQLWKRGEWQTPEPAQRNDEKYLLELTYPQKLRSVKVRVNFVCTKPRDYQKIELYEIELIDKK